MATEIVKGKNVAHGVQLWAEPLATPICSLVLTLRHWVCFFSCRYNSICIQAKLFKVLAVFGMVNRRDFTQIAWESTREHSYICLHKNVEFRIKVPP